ncbi:hypothetical protein CYMTET_12519, partial [Cymbomonas tetramitiformis]
WQTRSADSDGMGAAGCTGIASCALRSLTRGCQGERKWSGAGPGLELYEGKTSPPDYLTESELISVMEKHGIGTDASIPTHINNIIERNYVKVESGRRVVPTPLGVTLIKGYQVRAFPNGEAFWYPRFTASGQLSSTPGPGVACLFRLAYNFPGRARERTADVAAAGGGVSATATV